MVLMSSGPERRKESDVLIINGKHQPELEKKAAAETRPIETAALDMKPEKNRPKKRIVHGVETRHRTRD